MCKYGPAHIEAPVLVLRVSESHLLPPRVLSFVAAKERRNSPPAIKPRRSNRMGRLHDAWRRTELAVADSSIAKLNFAKAWH